LAARAWALKLLSTCTFAWSMVSKGNRTNQFVQILAQMRLPGAGGGGPDEIASVAAVISFMTVERQASVLSRLPGGPAGPA
jgi:hypothetical protein